MKTSNKDHSIIYLDYNATTPIDPDVVKEMIPFITTHYGNPSSSHQLGQKAKISIAKARRQVAQLIDCDKDDEIVFMSGGTETINYVLKGSAFNAFEKSFGKKNHIITSCIEHVAVLETCKFLETKGFKVTYVSVDVYGRVNLNEIENAITDSTFLISIMHSNNEVGTLQPIREISALAQSKNILFHSDASQSLGKVQVSVKDLGVDFLSIAGHKLYAPKGIGALYIRHGASLPQKLIHGASHENGVRAGTENVPYIVALGKACEMALKNIDSSTLRLKSLRQVLYEGLKEACDQPFRINTPIDFSLPNTLNISFKNLSATEIINDVQDRVALSAGSACHSSQKGDEQIHISYVLKSMQVPLQFAKGTLRLSLGRFSTQAEIEEAVIILSKSINSKMKENHSHQDPKLRTKATKKLYYENTYCFQSDAIVIAVETNSTLCKPDDTSKNAVLLNQTIFHPQGGGQPSDVGTIQGEESGVIFVVSNVRVDIETDIIHHLGKFQHDKTFSPSEKVILRIDERVRRYNARSHSAGHLIDRAMKDLGLQFPPLKGYHFSDGPFVEYNGKLSDDDKATLPNRLNSKCQKLIEEKIPTIVHLGNKAMAKSLVENCDVSHFPDDKMVRVVGIADFFCPCGGTHVADTSEIKSINILKVKSKGGKFKVYYCID